MGNNTGEKTALLTYVITKEQYEVLESLRSFCKFASDTLDDTLAYNGLEYAILGNDFQITIARTFLDNDKPSHIHRTLQEIKTEMFYRCLGGESLKNKDAA